MRILADILGKTANGGYHSRGLNAVIVGGWVAMIALGQWGVSTEVLVLEWTAILWLCIGLLLVSRTWCLPLLILSVPVFMCEHHRPWAWAQVLAGAFLLARILVEHRFSLRQYAALVLVGVAVFILSCPLGAEGLLREWLGFPRSLWLDQWLKPGATWAVFPFRASVDRTVVAVLVASIILSGRYFSSVRIWRALWLSAVLMLLASYMAWLLPWQQPHRFLGTSNFPSFNARLLNGAGYNIHYFVAGLACGIPFMFAVPRDGWRWIRLASVGLLPPTILIHQRGFSLFVLSLPFVGLLLAVLSLSRRQARRAIFRRWQGLSASRIRWTTVGLVCALGLSYACLARIGLLQEGSLVRSQLQIRMQTFFTLNAYRATGIGVEPGTNLPPSGQTNGQASSALPVTTVTQTGGWDGIDTSLSLSGRLEGLLMRLDDIRGRMWVVGLKESFRHHLWRGKGAGTWGRFHKKHPPPGGLYYAHMHNTYLDLIFEYGVVPMTLVFTICGVAVFRLTVGWTRMSRLWLFYLVPVAVVALGQHLMFSFTSLVLLMPAFIVLFRAFIGIWSKPANTWQG